MASIKIVARKKPLSDDTYPVCLRITKDRKTKYFKTLFSTDLSDWDESSGQFKKRNPSYIQNNRLLLKVKERAFNIYSKLELENEYFSLNKFEEEFRVNSNEEGRSVFSFWNEYMDELILGGRTGNARMHRDTYNSFWMFSKDFYLTFEELTVSMLSKYEAFLRSRGCTDGGISVRMRCLRALYNIAIERSLVKEEFYPFKKYKISRLKRGTIKRALDIDEVNKIVNFDTSSYPHLVNAKNYFVFSFYARGMNFADMMVLKWNDIEDDTIVYSRNKTKGVFRIKVLPPVHDVLVHYYRQHRPTDYVFPILLKNKLSPVQIENRKKKTLQEYNRNLKEIAKLVNIQKSLSSYVARHSFANCLKQKGIPTDIISESLGHKNLAITQVYLKQLDTEVVDKAMEILL